jgi:hypothetical protein
MRSARHPRSAQGAAESDDHSRTDAVVVQCSVIAAVASITEDITVSISGKQGNGVGRRSTRCFEAA